MPKNTPPNVAQAEMFDEKPHLRLPISGTTVHLQHNYINIDDCVVHPCNVRTLTDHNPVTLAEQMASFEREGQLFPALVVKVEQEKSDEDRKPQKITYQVIDGAGRLATWKLLREQNPGKYLGNVFFVCEVNTTEKISDEEVVALSKTSNQAVALSDYDKAKIYKALLDRNEFQHLKALTEALGLDYESWKKKIKLADIADKYIALFISTADIPSSFCQKVKEWDDMANGCDLLAEKYDEIIQKYSERTDAFKHSKPDTEHPYLDSHHSPAKMLRAITHELRALVREQKAENSLDKTPQVHSGIQFSSKKDRKGVWTLEIKQCDDELIKQIEEFIKLQNALFEMQ